jgi:hypothetical protein
MAILIALPALLSQARAIVAYSRPAGDPRREIPEPRKNSPAEARVPPGKPRLRPRWLLAGALPSSRRCVSWTRLTRASHLLYSWWEAWE